MDENLEMLVADIKNNLHKKDKNYLSVFYGPTGSGKTESSIALALQINPKLSQNHIVFSVEEFSNLMKSKQYQKGDAIVFDEMGVSADNREFYSKQNIALTQFMEVFRALNLSLIMSVPSLKMLDKRVLQLVHQVFRTNKIDFRKKQCRCRVYNWIYDDFQEKFLHPHPTHKKDGIDSVIREVWFDKPPESIVKIYKDRKQEFIESIGLKLESVINEKNKGRFEAFDPEPYVKRVLQQPQMFMNTKGRLDEDLIGGILELGIKRAMVTKKMATKALNLQ